MTTNIARTNPHTIPKNRISRLKPAGEWGILIHILLGRADDRSLTSAGTALRDAIARRRPTRYRPETKGGSQLVATAWEGRAPARPPPPQGKGKNSEHWENGRLARSRARAEELGKPERPPARTQQRIVALEVNFAKVPKCYCEIRSCATWANPTWRVF